jgi:hypothetical protein
MILVAGGGFVPQSLIDSMQLTDSTMVRNAKKGEKGDLFIRFSFSFGHRHEQKRWSAAFFKGCLLRFASKAFSALAVCFFGSHPA